MKGWSGMLSKRMRQTTACAVFSLTIPFSLACTGPAIAAQASASAENPPSLEEAALQAAADKAGVRDFYAKGGWHPVWSEDAAQALEQALSERKRHGLDRVQFASGGASDAGAAAQEVAHTRAALAYASALARGITDPASLQEAYTIPRPDPDLVAGLSKALSENDLAGWFGRLAPQDDEYRQLSKAYLRFRDEAKDEAKDATEEEISATGLIHVGDADPRVPAIIDQLVGGGYMSGDAQGRSGERPTGSPDGPASQAGPAVYTETVAAAVKSLQGDYGIADDGVIGPETLKVLNLGPGDRARALAVALERRRWLSRNPSATRINVNTAAARLRYYRDGQVADSRKVIVGQAGKETPGLLSPIYRLVANPTWTVPKSIQNGELANVGPDYFNSHNMVMRDGWIVQQPGPDNALGLVKFDMQNDQAIYLHDTSSPALFDRSQRHLSHGCVRVEDALGFAQRLAEEEGIADKWQQAAQSGEQTFVPLPQRIPVRLLYHNVFVDDGGKIAFRTDPYGWNDAVAQALGFGASPTQQAKADSVDIGP